MYIIQVEYLGFTGYTGTSTYICSKTDIKMNTCTGKLYDWLYTCTFVIWRFIETGNCCTSKMEKTISFMLLLLCSIAEATHVLSMPTVTITFLVLKARVTSLVESGHHLCPQMEVNSKAVILSQNSTYSKMDIWFISAVHSCWSWWCKPSLIAHTQSMYLRKEYGLNTFLSSV